MSIDIRLYNTRSGTRFVPIFKIRDIIFKLPSRLTWLHASYPRWARESDE